MPKELTWDDAEDLGILLSEKHPDLDRLSVRYTDLHRYVTNSPVPGRSQEVKRRKIRSPSMAWHKEFQDRTA